MNVDVVLQLLLSIWLGALIWMERGVKLKSSTSSQSSASFWWIRTFALISFLGALSAWVSILFKSSIFIIVLLIILAVFIWIYYSYTAFREKQIGLTTEISAIITFFLWVFVMAGQAEIAIILSIILTFLLSASPLIDKITSKVSTEELNNTIKFAIIAIVILPLLPDVKYSIADILSFLWYANEIQSSILNLSFFNPYGIWFFVVLMSWISYAGYIMSKVIGEKGSIIASGAIGGLISSTAVTASMSESSKKDKRNTDLYVVSTLLASTIMFIRVIIIVLFFNINMLSAIIYPSGFMFVWIVLYIVHFYLKSKKKDIVVKTTDFEEKKYSSPFSVWPALKFAWFVLIIKFVAGVGGLYKDIWWDSFFYVLWVISWLADVDAISQTMSVDALDGRVWLSLAVITIIIAIISNNFVKWSIALKFWEKTYGRAVMLWFIVSMIMWILWVVFFNIVG